MEADYINEKTPLYNGAGISETTLIAEGRLHDGRTFIGPAFKENESKCRRCLISRILAAGNVPLGSIDFVRHSILSKENSERFYASKVLLLDNAALLDRKGKLQRPLFVPPANCTCIRVERVKKSRKHITSAVSDLFGLVKEVEKVTFEEQHTLAIAHGSRTIGTSGATALAYGSATNEERSTAIKLGIIEALERYSAAFWNHENLIEIQDGRESSGSIAMVEAQNCESGTLVLVPARNVYLPFNDIIENHVYDSAGLAAGDTEKSAYMRALAERIERDVFSDIVSGHSRPLSRADKNLILLGVDTGFEVWLALEFQEEAPFCVIGLGCAQDRRTAKEKAKSELRHVKASMHLVMQNHRGEKLRVNEGLDRHILSLAFERKTSNQWHKYFSNVPYSLKYSSTQVILRKRAAVNVTSPDLCTFGLYVYRVVTILKKEGVKSELPLV